MTTINRPWGQEIIIAQTPTYMGKILKRKAGTMGDFQSHLKHESHYLLKGELRVYLGPARTYMLVRAGDDWHIEAGTLHQEEALTECVEIEISEPTLNDRQVEESVTGLPSTPEADRQRMARDLAVAYLRRASELLA